MRVQPNPSLNASSMEWNVYEYNAALCIVTFYLSCRDVFYWSRVHSTRTSVAWLNINFIYVISFCRVLSDQEATLSIITTDCQVLCVCVMTPWIYIRRRLPDCFISPKRAAAAAGPDWLTISFIIFSECESRQQAPFEARPPPLRRVQRRGDRRLRVHHEEPRREAGEGHGRHPQPGTEGSPVRHDHHGWQPPQLVRRRFVSILFCLV